MTDNLRDRIAAVIFYEDGHRDKGWAERTADAVITALGLREEFGALDSEQGGFLADTREQLTLGRGEAMYRRFITDWETHG